MIAVVSIEQDNGNDVGVVEAAPAGWTRLFEHSPAHAGFYQGWFAHSNCAGGLTSATFVLASPGNSTTLGSVVISEFSGLPAPLGVDLDVNDGSRTVANTWSLTGQAPSSSGELTLSALSLNAQAASAQTPPGWNLAGSASDSLPSYMYWQVGTSSAPSASFAWSTPSLVETTMLVLRGGTTAESILQEAAGAFSNSASASLQLPDGVAPHDALIAVVGTSASSSAPQVASLAGGGVTWHEVVNEGQAAGTSEIWAGFDSQGTAGPTSVTASFSGAPATGVFSLAEASGLTGVDASASNVGASQTATATTLGAKNDDLIVAALTSNGSPLVAHPTPQWSSFSVPSLSYATEWVTNGTIAAPAPTWTIGSPASWVVTQAAFTTSGVQPLLRLTSSVVRRHGDLLAVQVSCPTGECVGSIVLQQRVISATHTSKTDTASGRTVVLGRSRLRVPGGAHRTLRITLSASGRQAFATERLPIRAQIVAKIGKVSTSHWVTVR